MTPRRVRRALAVAEWALAAALWLAPLLAVGWRFLPAECAAAILVLAGPVKHRARRGTLRPRPHHGAAAR